MNQVEIILAVISAHRSSPLHAPFLNMSEDRCPCGSGKAGQWVYDARISLHRHVCPECMTLEEYNTLAELEKQYNAVRRA